VSQRRRRRVRPPALFFTLPSPSSLSVFPFLFYFDPSVARRPGPPPAPLASGVSGESSADAAAGRPSATGVQSFFAAPSRRRSSTAIRRRQHLFTTEQPFTSGADSLYDHIHKVPFHQFSSRCWFWLSKDRLSRRAPHAVHDAKNRELGEKLRRKKRSIQWTPKVKYSFCFEPSHRRVMLASCHSYINV